MKRDNMDNTACRVLILNASDLCSILDIVFVMPGVSPENSQVWPHPKQNKRKKMDAERLDR